MSRLPSNGIELEFEEMGGVEFSREFCRALAERSFRVVRFDNRSACRRTCTTQLYSEVIPDLVEIE